MQTLPAFFVLFYSWQIFYWSFFVGNIW